MEDSRPSVQRTLVKSPPELWADLSNPETLARRLGEFGEIRITHLVPERTVAWEGERASGTVEIEPSGWGTKVRLTARPTAPAIEEEMITDDDLERELALRAQDRAETEREAAIEAALLAEVQREADEEATLRAEAEAEAQAEGARVREAQASALADHQRTVESLPSAQAPAEGAPRKGFFARLFKRRTTPTGAESHAPTTSPAVSPGQSPTSGGHTAVPGRASPETPKPTPGRPTAPGQRPPVRLKALGVAPRPGAAAPPTSGEQRPPAVTTTTAEFDKPGAETIAASRHPRSGIPAKPALDDEQTLAVLAGVLDDLGAAHHRPFSREMP